MEIRTTYISDDGTEFDTEEECLEYEAVYKDTSSVILLDEKKKLIDMSDLADAFERCHYIHIVKEPEARLFLDYVESFCGCGLPRDAIKEGHTYAYDEVFRNWEDNYWVDLDERYSEIAAEYNSVKEALSKVG